MNTTVSIITPIYNHEKYISRCIESVLNQTYANWELIMIDDGSTDNSAEIASEYTTDDRIHLIEQKNKGINRLNETYNKGLSMSTGDYIAILEGDDFWPENKLSYQVRYHQSEEVVLSWGRSILVDSNGEIPSIIQNPLTKYGKRDKKLYNSSDMVEKLLLEGQVCQPVTVLLDKDTLESIGGFQQYEGQPYVDYPTFMAVAKSGPALYLNESLGFYRIHEDQVSSSDVEKMALSELDFMHEFYRSNSGIDLAEEKLIEREKKVKTGLSVTKGRIALTREDYSSAIHHFNSGFTSAWRIGAIYQMSLCLIGLIHCLFHTDLEWLPKMVNKRWYT